jgi:hypothetical protein
METIYPLKRPFYLEPHGTKSQKLPIIYTIVKTSHKTVIFDPTYYPTMERRNIPEDGILHSHRRENLKSYMTLTGRTDVGFRLRVGKWFQLRRPDNEHTISTALQDGPKWLSRLDGCGSVPEKGNRFVSPLIVHTGSGAHLVSYQLGTGGDSRRVKLTTHLHPVPRSRMAQLHLHSLTHIQGVLLHRSGSYSPTSHRGGSRQVMWDLW